MNPAERNQRLRAVVKTYHNICKRRGLTQAQKDAIFEEYLVRQYGLGATARRDYKQMAQSIKTIDW